MDDSTPEFWRHLGGTTSGDCGSNDFFGDEPTQGSIVGFLWAAGPAFTRRCRHVASAHAENCQAKTAGGAPPARAIIASNRRHAHRADHARGVADQGITCSPFGVRVPATARIEGRSPCRARLPVEDAHMSLWRRGLTETSMVMYT